jgi:hypothetical protein
MVRDPGRGEPLTDGTRRGRRCRFGSFRSASVSGYGFGVVVRGRKSARYSCGDVLDAIVEHAAPSDAAAPPYSMGAELLRRRRSEATS